MSLFRIQIQLVVLLLGLFFGLSVTATLPKECKSGAPMAIKDRDVKGIEAFVQAQPDDSFACMIHRLPENVRGFRTYVKKSLSLQEASLMNPRAIVGSTDGGFFLTFNGDKKQKGHGEVEFLALDQNIKPSKWIAGSIVRRDGKLKVLKNLPKCHSCHGNPIRPIMGQYPRWENMYGSIDDWLPNLKNPAGTSNFYYEDQALNRLTVEDIKVAKSESRSFREFRKKAVNHPRYSALEKASDENSSVYPYTEDYRSRNPGFRPNLALSSAMLKRQVEILRNRILNNGFYKKYSNTLAYHSFCDSFDSVQEEPMMTQIQTLFEVEYENAFNSPTPENLTQSNQSYNYYKGAEPSNLQRKALLLLSGVKTHELTLSFGSDPSFFSKKDQNYGSGYLNLESVLKDWAFQESIRKLNSSNDYITTKETSYLDMHYSDWYAAEKAKSGSKHYSRFQSKYLGKEFDQFVNPNFWIPTVNVPEFTGYEENYGEVIINHQSMCQELSKKLPEEFGTEPYYKKNKPGAEPPLPYPTAIQSCVECHDSTNSVGTLIPFSNARTLYEFGVKEYGNDGLFSLIKHYTNSSMTPAHKNGLRMPLGRPPLTEAEIEKIRLYLESGKMGIKIESQKPKGSY